MKLDDAEKTAFVKDYVLNVEFDDYDKLIQLADFMAGSHGITTIERRFCSVLSRHELPEPQKVLRKLYELKEKLSSDTTKGWIKTNIRIKHIFDTAFFHIREVKEDVKEICWKVSDIVNISY